MKLKPTKIVICLAAGLFGSTLALPPIASADTTLSVQASGSGVTATGTYSQNGVPLAGAPALLTVKDASNNIDYVDQGQTDANGHYRFVWTMPSNATGNTFTAEVHVNGEIQTANFTSNSASQGDTILPINLGPYRFTGELNSGSKQAVIYDTNSGLVVTNSGDSSTVTLDSNKAANTIYMADANSTYLTISVPTHDHHTQVTVPGSLLQKSVAKFGNNMHLLAAAETGSYDLPLSALNATLLNNVLNSSDGALVFQIGQADTQTSALIWQQETNLPAQPMVAPVQFGLEAIYGGQSIPIHDFGGSFVRFSVDLTGATLNNSAVQSALFLDPISQQLMPAPSKLYHDSVGYGKVVITRTGNGDYCPVQASHTFDDVQYNFAKDKIQTLAGKFVISGKTSSEFDPNGNITRAEFSTLMVRALGLSDKQGSSLFDDVQNNSWYGHYVAVGSSLGLISGYSSNQFAPNDVITREQMAALLARSLQFVQTKPYVDTTRILGQLQDRNQISTWARDDVALAISAGIVDTGTTVFDPQRPATRAESALMLYNLLNYLQLL